MGSALNTWHEVAPPAYAPLDRYGLFSVAQMRTDSLTDGRLDPHWRVGIEWVSPACWYGWAYDGLCLDPPASLIDQTTCSINQFEPFTAYTYIKQEIPGWTLEQHKQFAVEQFQLVEEREVGYWLQSVWNATFAADLDYSSYNGWYGLAAIEDFMGWTTAGQFTIHMPRAAAVALSLHLKPEGGVLRTITGTPVSVMSGIQNNGGGAYPFVYVYATGPVVVYRGDIVVYESTIIDKATNKTSLIPQRDYAVGWDCDVYRFKISLDTPPPL